MTRLEGNVEMTSQSMVVAQIFIFALKPEMFAYLPVPSPNFSVCTEYEKLLLVFSLEDVEVWYDRVLVRSSVLFKPPARPLL